MKKKANRFIGLSSVFVLAGSLALYGCGGGGDTPPTAGATNTDGETLSSQTSGLTLPSEVSAVPASSTPSSSLYTALRNLSSAVAALPATSDYANAKGAKYIKEPTIDQFEIIEEVLNAVAQTNYSDPTNINNGPYKAMVAMTDENQGIEIKKLEPWVVDSRMIVVDGQDVNRVLCWIEEVDRMNPTVSKTIKAEMKIYAAATLSADGEILDLGTWELNVSFSDDASNFFVASAEPNPNGGSILRVNEYENFGPGDEHTMKGVLYRAGTVGYGKVLYTDYDSCTEWPCTPTNATAKYAYNTDYLGVQKESAAIIYKDRSLTYDMTHRYGLFYDENATGTGPTGKAIVSGDNVMKHYNFGFPVVYTSDNDGGRYYAYYGAWQGRHQLWGSEDGGFAADQQVTKESWGSGAAETYTIADPLLGSFTKRTYVDATLDDIKNVPVETWIDKRFDLFFDGANWQKCADGWIDFSGPTCMGFDNNPKSMTTYTPNGELIVGPEDRKWVGIGRWDNINSLQKDYVYIDSTVVNPPSGYSSPGFFEAQQGQNGLQAKDPAVPYTPSTNDQLWVSIGGSIYIAYVGFPHADTTTGWVQKELQEFDTRNWKPVFTGTNSPFTPDMGREYYMNSNGVNYVIKRKANVGSTADDYEAFLEVQTTANPANCTATDCTDIIPDAVDYLRTPWDPNMRYALVTAAADPNYLLVKFLTDDINTTSVDESAVTTVYSQGAWGLQGWNNGTDTVAGTTDDFPVDALGAAVTVDEWGFPTGGETDRPVEFNWEYAANGGWGQQQYLKDISGNYVILSDPIMLNAFDATNGASVTKTLMLQYDGWLHGLPDMHQALQQNDWEMTTDLADKIINIPAGQEVTDGTNGFYLKPLDTSVFLAVVGDTTGLTLPDVTQADAINLTTDVPDYTAHGMGTMPVVTTVKYSEGVLVE
ncbi:MAG: hypothetical protein KKE17_04510 [Proteobacteria bacterium]|nr:hypothetical protein [Pseudomonadota bacterium]MBU1709249.1 hypothetical protein [Pseudomonadota bacterium]